VPGLISSEEEYILIGVLRNGRINNMQTKVINGPNMYNLVQTQKCKSKPELDLKYYKQSHQKKKKKNNAS